MLNTSFKVNDRMVITVEGKDQRDLFEQLASLQEVFGDSKCGACGKSNLKFVVRDVEKDGEENRYYEMRCADCGARLTYGCHKKGNSLFPKRKDADGKFSKTNGWSKYVPQQKTE